MATTAASTARTSKRAMDDEKSLLVIVVDVSPTAWGEREVRRAASDKARLAAGKRSVGPATMDECLSAVRAFCGAYDSLQRDSVFIVIAVAGNESAVVYPRKNELHRFFAEGGKVEIRKLEENLSLEVAELVNRAASKAVRESLIVNANNGDMPAETPGNNGGKDTTKKGSNGNGGTAAMASALSRALALINRFLVTSGGGVSAVATNASALWNRQDDEGVLSLLGGKKRRRDRGGNTWSPRVLMIQASEDRTRDYNAFMNCAFAASKNNVVVDGCFIPSGMDSAKSSAFLEQTVDLTQGVFLAPSGAAQVGGCLTEVLLSVFLAPLSVRPDLNLPSLNKVDFRARCFETGDSVDIGHVCNQCLSIFKNKPKHFCPTCGAQVRKPGESDTKARIENSGWKA